MNKKGAKHLSLSERISIEVGLAKELSCKEIAISLEKDDRTISKEVKKRRTKRINNRPLEYRFKDHRTCKKLDRYPCVCNSRNSRSSCKYDYKYYYEAKVANTMYLELLKSCREGIDFKLEDKAKLDAILVEGCKKGQSIHHIVESNKENITCSSRTIYRLIDNNQTVIKPYDLIRKVKLKPRKKYKYVKDSKVSRNSRSYEDFISYYARNPGIGIVEMDVVEGNRTSKHSKCLLTLHFVAFRFMLIYMLEQQTTNEVNRIFEHLKKILGNEDFKIVFPVILTDRGKEFSNPENIEIDSSSGEVLTRIFFCDSYASYQKGAIEENHTLLRYVLPKGTSFDDLNEEKISILTNHLNSYYRKSLGGMPYNLAKAYFKEGIMAKLKVRAIDPNLVTLKPNLLK